MQVELSKLQVMPSFCVNSMVRGYHVYKDVWQAMDGEILSCMRETSNGHDPFAVAVLKDDTIVGHVPRSLSAICSLFLRKGGSITCLINGSRRYSSDLPQGGLEVPCVLTFCGEDVLIQKVKKLISTDKLIDTMLSKDKEKTDPSVKEEPESPKKKKIRSEECIVWVRLEGLILNTEDRSAIIAGDELNDKHIDFFQQLLKLKFPCLSGLKSTLLPVFAHERWTSNYVQVFHCRNNHWITVSTVGCMENRILVYDSLYNDVDKATQNKISVIFPGVKFDMKKVKQIQTGVKDLWPICFGLCNASCHWY